jgi:hypothetical protein
MYGLPDSAVVGTVKRLTKSRGGRRKTTEVGWEDFFFLVNAVKRFRARRIKQKKRAEFFKKHGYYKQ